MIRVGREMEEDLSSATARGWLRAEFASAEMRARHAADYSEITGRPAPRPQTPSLARYFQERIRGLQEGHRRAQKELSRLGGRRSKALQPRIRYLQETNRARKARIRRLRRLVAGPWSEAHLLQKRVGDLERKRERLNRELQKLDLEKREIEEDLRRVVGPPIEVPAPPPTPRAPGDALVITTPRPEPYRPARAGKRKAAPPGGPRKRKPSR